MLKTCIILLVLVTTTISSAEEKIQSTPTPVFCGLEGGYTGPTAATKFPIETRARARAALSYAYWAPNPDGIRSCVCRNYPDLPSCKRK